MSRVIEGSGTYSYFPDDYIDPLPTALLRSYLDRALPEPYRASAIELVRFDVGVWVFERDKMVRQQPIMIFQGVLTGPLILANLVSAGLSLSDRKAVQRAATASIEVTVGGTPISAGGFASMYSGRSPLEAVETALSGALEDLATKVGGLKKPSTSVPVQ